MSATFRVTIFSAAFLLSHASLGTTESPQPLLSAEISEGPTIDWPQTAPKPVRLKRFEVQEDGPPEARIIFQSPNVSLELEDHGKWQPSSKGDRPVSIRMDDKRFPGVSLSVSRFAKSEFLEDLEDENWNAYLNSITQSSHETAIVFEHDSAKGKASPLILDRRYRQVYYEQSFADGTTWKTREFFSFIGDDLFVFAIQGPKDRIDALTRTHNLILSRMDYAETKPQSRQELAVNSSDLVED